MVVETEDQGIREAKNQSIEMENRHNRKTVYPVFNRVLYFLFLTLLIIQILYSLNAKIQFYKMSLQPVCVI